MRTTRRVTVAVPYFTDDEITGVYRAHRQVNPGAPHRDVFGATARTLELLAADVMTINLGRDTSRLWRQDDSKTRRELRRQANRVARHHGKEVRLRDDRGILVYTARSHADR